VHLKTKIYLFIQGTYYVLAKMYNRLNAKTIALKVWLAYVFCGLLSGFNRLKCTSSAACVMQYIIQRLTRTDAAPKYFKRKSPLGVFN